MPLLQERFKGLPENQIENYIRRIVHIGDTTPVSDTINVMQGKRILDFIDSQENVAKVSPPKIYAVIERIINDSKISSSSSKSDESFSKLFERHRIE